MPDYISSKAGAEVFFCKVWMSDHSLQKAGKKWLEFRTINHQKRERRCFFLQEGLACYRVPSSWNVHVAVKRIQRGRQSMATKHIFENADKYGQLLSVHLFLCRICSQPTNRNLLLLMLKRVMLEEKCRYFTGLLWHKYVHSLLSVWSVAKHNFF